MTTPHTQRQFCSRPEWAALRLARRTRLVFSLAGLTGPAYAPTRHLGTAP